MIKNLKNSKIISNIVTPIALAFVVAMFLTTFVVSKVEVKASVLNEYPINSTVVLNKLDKNISVGDIIVFKKSTDTLIRKIIKIDNSQVTVSDKDNNTLTIAKNDVLGKVTFKLW